tara:strand:+ start:626 stop:1240 length:615 start_codon:yes stop_codon:yes gene_type:complete
LKKIVIAPHIDDDVLGCGGIIDSDTLTLYCGVDDFHIISKEDRLKEADAVRDFYKNKYILLENTKVNEYKVKDLIDEFQKVINEYQPEEVYIPYPSYNQDHRVVYEAALIALRPHDNNHFVNKVLVYEQPHVFLWNNTHNINGEFKPNYFKPIAIDLKIAAYELMESQVREFRGTEDIRALAKLRGTQSNYQCAEAFQVVRCVE